MPTLSLILDHWPAIVVADVIMWCVTGVAAIVWRAHRRGRLARRIAPYTMFDPPPWTVHAAIYKLKVEALRKAIP